MPQTSSEALVPSIIGPAAYSRLQSDPPPLSIDLGAVRYYAVELATDSSLFSTDKQVQRSDADFFASWRSGLIGPIEAGTYVMPQDVWNKMRPKAALYYRVLSSSAADSWQLAAASTPSDHASSAPAIRITDDPPMSPVRFGG